MRIPLFIFFTLISTVALGQKIQSSNDALRWEISVASGPYLDMFWLTENNRPGYPTKPGKGISWGKIDRIEVKYLFNKKSAFSIYFQNASWKEIFGDQLDPLGAWIDLKDDCRRMHFTLHYYRMFPSGKKGTWSIGSGFQVQIEKKSFPFYRVDDPTNPTVITEISSRPDWTYFEDWAIPLTVAHHWTINKNLKLGIMLNTAYTTGTGIDGLSLLGNIAIPFGKQIRK
jgi:hypothetical protein